jgi:prepilin-type N-terminal cleavage/methylation domain-containing protein
MRRAFTLIELLVVIAIIAILAAILFPVFTSARKAAWKSHDLSNFKQLGMGLQMYLGDYDDRIPDRRDLKLAYPGGLRPWTSWPASDPRSGWAVDVFHPYIKNDRLLESPLARSAFRGITQVEQQAEHGLSNIWMWRFDQVTDPAPLDNLWGKTPDQGVADLIAAASPFIGIPDGPSDVELAVTPYFPRTIPSVEAGLRGKGSVDGGRVRLFLDTHAKFLRDPRVN